jgi:hypothetical protein
MKHMAPFYWPIQVAILATWGGLHIWQHQSVKVEKNVRPSRLADAA